MTKIIQSYGPILWRHKGQISIFMLFFILATLLESLFPLYIQDVISILKHGTNTSEIEQAFEVIAFLTFLSLARWISGMIFDYFYVLFQAESIQQMYKDTLETILKQSLPFFQNSLSGKITAQVQKYINAFESLSDIIVFQFCYQGMFFIIIFLIFLQKNVFIALALLTWSLIFIGISTYASSYSTPHNIAAEKAENQLLGKTADIFGNIITVKTTGSEHAEKASLSKVIKNWHDFRLKEWTVGNYYIAFQVFFIYTLKIMILIIGVKLLQDNIINIEEFLIFQWYATSLAEKINNIGYSIQATRKHIAEASEVITILETPPAIIDAPNAQKLKMNKGSISINNISFTYGSKALFTDFSLTIPAQKKIALVGTSGSGKSSLIKLILRLFDVHSGEIRIDNQNIQEVTQQSLRESISFIAQEPSLFCLSIRENILYGNQSATEEEMIEAAKKAQCHDFVNQLSEGYDTIIGERGVKLSGGERQRIAIAKSILENAPILILDEATSALDSHTEHHIQQALNEAMKDKTVIAIAHRLGTIKQYDTIIVMENGAIRESGTHESLINQKGKYHQLWMQQSDGII